MLPPGMSCVKDFPVFSVILCIHLIRRLISRRTLDKFICQRPLDRNLGAKVNLRGESHPPLLMTAVASETMDRPFTCKITQEVHEDPGLLEDFGGYACAHKINVRAASSKRRVTLLTVSEYPRLAYLESSSITPPRPTNFLPSFRYHQSSQPIIIRGSASFRSTPACTVSHKERWHEMRQGLTAECGHPPRDSW